MNALLSLLSIRTDFHTVRFLKGLTCRALHMGDEAVDVVNFLQLHCRLGHRTFTLSFLDIQPFLSLFSDTFLNVLTYLTLGCYSKYLYLKTCIL